MVTGKDTGEGKGTDGGSGTDKGGDVSEHLMEYSIKHKASIVENRRRSDSEEERADCGGGLGE